MEPPLGFKNLGLWRRPTLIRKNYQGDCALAVVHDSHAFSINIAYCQSLPTKFEWSTLGARADLEEDVFFEESTPSNAFMKVGKT